MKTRDNLNPVTHIGAVGRETEFTIASNAQAFEILSAGIYTDPIMAVVRELSCNAYDAMVEAGKEDTPFKIHLPNKLEPTFSVIDDGIGLSDEDIRGLYANYFQSTKTGTNKQIGAFGLGSKSPFSYTKIFHVISRFGGEKRTYSVSVNEHGVPTMHEQACIDTDECNGIEIKIAVRTQDYQAFADKTREVLRYFPVKPIISGSSGFTFPQSSDSATVTDTYIVDKEQNGLVAVQGNVPYKVPQSQIEKVLSGAAQRFMSRHRIVLFFDIGMLDIAASREEVRYDETTVQNIADALQVAFNDYLVKLDEMLTELTAVGSRWDVYLTLRNKFGSKTELERLVGTNYKFESEMANQWMTDDKIEYTTTRQYHRIVPYSKGDARAVRGHHNYDGYGADRTYYIHPSESTKIVIQDVTTRGPMRMNTILRNTYSSGTKTLMAIIPLTDRALTNLGITASSQDRATELAAIIEQFGSPEVEKISDITTDVAQAARATRTSGHSFKTFVVPYMSSHRRNTKPEFRDAVEPDNGGLYIEVDLLRNLIIGGEKHNISSRDLRDQLTPVLNVINLARGTDYTPRDIFCLTKKVVKYVSTNSEWESVVGAYKEAIEDQKDIIEYYERIGNSTSLGMGDALNKDEFVRMVRSLDTNSNFRNIMEPIIDAAATANNIAYHAQYPVSKSDFRNELRSFERLHKIYHDVKDDAFFTAQDLAEYKMLTHINFRYDAKDAKDYIELVER